MYILNRDAEARLTISSPLEAHKSNTLVYHTVGVDVGFENPMFACLEIDYEVNQYRYLLLATTCFGMMTTSCVSDTFDYKQESKITDQNIAIA